MRQRPQKIGPRRGLTVLVLLGWLVLGIALAPPGFAEGVPNDVCADCHDEIAEAFANTAHGIYFLSRPALAEYGCESCHGSAAQHIEEGTAESIINPARHDQFGGKEMCLTCHDDAGFDDWAFSHHNTGGLNCADCHQMHADVGVHAQSLKAELPGLCYDCHTGVRAAFVMPSHHPVREGMLDCSDCHAPHGGTVSLTHEGSGRELCFSCHADKEGPFVYEHAPANEDCMLCHTPHGSVANDLLREGEPALCLNCHAMHFHATVEGVDGPFSAPQAPERTGISTPDGWKRGMLTKCTQCHTGIHGTDMPSQSISTGGNALTR